MTRRRIGNVRRQLLGDGAAAKQGKRQNKGETIFTFMAQTPLGGTQLILIEDLILHPYRDNTPLHQGKSRNPGRVQPGEPPGTPAKPRHR